MIPFMKAYLVSPSFIDNVIIQVDTILVVVWIEICGRDISQLLNVVENSINWCIHIKGHIFDHILTLGNHLRCDFSISVEEMLDNDADGILDGFSFSIVKISDVLRVNSCSGLLT